MFNLLKSKIKTNNILELTLNDIRLPKLVYEHTSTVKRRTYRRTSMKMKAVRNGLYPIADHQHLNIDFIHHGKDDDCITKLGTLPMILTLKNSALY